MEVMSRWLSGLRSVTVEELSLGVPRESELEMSIAGSFDELSMSLYIGQCITPDNLFRSTNDTMETNDGNGTKKKFGKPICSALWDKVYSWKQVTRFPCGTRSSEPVIFLSYHNCNISCDESTPSGQVSYWRLP